MVSTSVLNPVLYDRLQRHFGQVRVSNPGQAMVARTVTDLITDLPRLDISQRGEVYRVCCCFCSDRGFQLSINHKWGQRDDMGRPMFFLAHCFNNNCLSNRENREELIRILDGRDGFLDEAHIRQGRLTDSATAELKLPGKFIRLDRLGEMHPACQFLRGRHLKPKVVGRFYGVGYCGQSNQPLARGRLVIPIHLRNELQGWQALRIDGPTPADETDDTPRYFNAPGMKRSELLYNLDRARNYETGVIVAEPMDVWVLGPMALSPFGPGMSDMQRRRFVTAFYGHTAVLLLRSSMFDRPETQRWIISLRGPMSGQFVPVRLPDDEPLASLGRNFLRSYVKKEARAKGKTVTFAKRQ